MKGRIVSWGESWWMVLIMVLPIWISQATAMEVQNIPISGPFHYQEYHVHYDVNADGTYKESVELRMTVMNEKGVEKSKSKPLGIPNSGWMVPGTRVVNIVSAYTSKKDGRRMDATPAIPAPGAAVSMNPFLAQAKVMSFPDVEVGDTLVASYTVDQTKPLFPNNIVLTQMFPSFVGYDDASIRLDAPLSMKLRVDLHQIHPGTTQVTGNTQHMVWTYRTPASVIPQSVPPPGSQLPPTWPRIHISSFPDEQAEFQAVRGLMAALPPPTLPAMPLHPSLPNSMTCNAQGDIAKDGPAAVERVEDLVRLYFWHDEYLLKEAADEWNKPGCVFEDGRPILSALNDGFGSNFRQFNSQPDWSPIAARLKVLKKEFPHSAFVVTAEAEYWMEYAWNARGGGYASSVTQEGWKLFHDRMENAEKVLLDTKSYSAQFPTWYQQMIEVQAALGRPAEEQDKTFFEGVQKFKTFYPIYFTRLNFLTPQWGGSFEEIDKMVNWSVQNTQEIDGKSMYARMYWALYPTLLKDVELFKDTRASWPKMKDGFEDLMTRHPRSKWNLNNFAKFACMANDKKTFLELRRKIGKDVIDAAWFGNTPIDLCETKFGYLQ